MAGGPVYQPRVAEETVLVLAAHTLVAAEAEGRLGHVRRARVDDIAAPVARSIVGSIGKGLRHGLLAEGVGDVALLRSVEWCGLRGNCPTGILKLWIWNRGRVWHLLLGWICVRRQHVWWIRCRLSGNCISGSVWVLLQSLIEICIRLLLSRIGILLWVSIR